MHTSVSKTEESASHALSPRLLPFVGRQKQADLVTDFLQSTIAGDTAGLLWLQGEAGVGKSRFLDHIQHELSREENLVLYVRIYPDSASSVVMAFGSAIAANPQLRGLLPSRPIRSLSDLTAALQRASRLRPTLLIVDDIHLLDHDSAAELVDLIDALSNEPIGIICSARPGATPAFRALYRFRMRQVDIGPLGYEEVREVIRQCYGENFTDDVTLARVYEATHGIPLIIRAAMTDCLHRNSDSILYLEPTVAPPPGFHAKARFATEALVSCLIVELNNEEQVAASNLAVLGEVFSRKTAELLLGKDRELIDRLLEHGILTPALGQPQPLLPQEDGAAESDEIMAFSHTLLHEHLTAAPGFPLEALLDTIEKGGALYSIHPLLRIADASIKTTERTLRILVTYVDSLADSINRLLATPAYNAAVSLFERHTKELKEETRLDFRLALLRLRLQITSHIPQHPEFEGTLSDLMQETEAPTTELLAAHRLAALEFSTYRPEGPLEKHLGSCLDEAETLLETFPMLVSEPRYLRLIGTIAGATRSSPSSEVLNRVRRQLEHILETELIDQETRRLALIWVAAPILSIFTTPEDLDDRRELASRIEEEFGRTPKQGRLLSLWPQYLEASGEMTRARMTLENHIISPFKGYNLPEELALRMLALSADAALGQPLRKIERTASDILEETSELFPGPQGEQTRELVRSSVSAYLLLIGVLRGSPGWGRRVVTLLAGEGKESEADYYLPFEQAAVNGDFERLKVLYESGGVPETYRPLVFSLVHDGEQDSAAIGAIRHALHDPIFRRQDILRLHVTIGLSYLGVAIGRLSPRGMKEEIRPALKKGMEWCATHSLPGYLDALLGVDRAILRKKERQEWLDTLAELQSEIAVLPVYYSYTEEEIDNRTPLSMIGKIGYRDGDGVMQRISGSRARHVLGLLTAQELTRRRYTLEEFRLLATGMEESEEGANYLRIILSRLRRTLGHEAILNTPKEAPRLNLEQVRVDAIEADRLFRQGSASVRAGEPREAFDVIQKALQIAGGHTLLPTLYDEIFEDARREFEITMRSASLALLELLQEEEDDEQAIRLLRLAAQAMPSDEEVCEMLADQLRLVGRHVEAWSSDTGSYDRNVAPRA